MLGLLLVAACSSAAAAGDGAVFIMYHRVGEGEYPTTSVTAEQFESHIALLTGGGFTVMPAEEIVAALRNGSPLPEKPVAITFDDAYLSVYTEAWPRLRKASLPFTVFIATQPVDLGTERYMSWDQIREMKAAGVAVGAHTETHNHMVTAGEARNRAELQRSTERYVAELGGKPVLFAYPYGEAGHEVRDLVKEQGYTAAFGQHSGVAYRAGDQFFLPRFSFNEAFGDIDHFRHRVNALPLPAIEITPADPLLAANPPAFGFTVQTPLRGLDRLACYHPQFDSVMIERLGTQRFEVRFPEAFRNGRSRLNCTAPGPDGRYHWFGWQFHVRGGG